ncbi:MAG: hypothetical protein QM756_10025 [Polyangiaceae bacterium]
MVIDNNGVITGENAPITCVYQVNVITAGGSSESSVIPGTVTATVTNIAPVAANDVYVRPVGVVQLALDVMANDTDVDDSSPFDNPTHHYPIYIASKPTLGTLKGDTGLCPGSNYNSGTPKFCYTRNLSYEASNAQSPFTDYFQYSVYDDEGGLSNTALVTIKTNAPIPTRVKPVAAWIWPEASCWHCLACDVRASSDKKAALRPFFMEFPELS